VKLTTSYSFDMQSINIITQLTHTMLAHKLTSSKSSVTSYV
jgi:hypothetical protein